MRQQTVLVEQEQWFRDNGLPLVVPPARRLRGLIQRTVPLLVTFALLASALLIADAAISTGEEIALNELLQHDEVIMGMLIASLVMFAAIPLGMLYAALQRLLRPRVQLTLGLLVISFWLVGLSALAGLAQLQHGLHLDIGSRILLLLFAAGYSYFELGSMIGWAARRGLREITSTLPSIARILPLLMLTVLLVFFTNELWQLAATMPKERMWALGIFLVILVVLIILPTAIDMVNDGADDDESLLATTPFAGCDTSPSRLSWGERYNLIFVGLAVQAVQTFGFVVIAFLVFATFGSISLTPQLIATWSEAQPQSLVWLGIRLPMDAAMFRVCLVLALFSGITFAASTIQEERYRSLFLERVSSEVRRSLAARHRYRTTLADCGGSQRSRWMSLISDR